MTYALRTDEILPDILNADIRILFVGSAPTPASAASGHYYADDSEQFYHLLYDAGFTDEKLLPDHDLDLLNYHIGLTHLTKTKTTEQPGDLEPVDYSIGRLIRLVFEFTPRIVCFNGKTTYRQFFDLTCSFGNQKTQIGEAAVYVVPASNSRHDRQPYREKLGWFKELFQVVNQKNS